MLQLSLDRPRTYQDKLSHIVKREGKHTIERLGGGEERGHGPLEREWKNTLYSYVKEYNRSEIDYKPQEQHIITDLAVLLERGKRAAQLDEWYRDRQAVPLRCETSAKLLRTLSDRKGEAVADVQLYSRLFYSKGGITHREDRIEKERLTFTKDGNHWVVSRVVRDVQERKPVAYETLIAAENAKQAGIQRKPLLNREVLYPGIPARLVRYRREDAVAYADQWWNSGNPEFEEFEVNCTNYISQCLFAGGAPINYTGRRETGWWYKGYVSGQEQWSYSWAVSDSLENYLARNRSGLTATLIERPEQLQLGDVIFYDWNGDGRYQHSTIVTAFDAGGMPLVNANTVSSRHRYWDYKDSYAWTENTTYRLFHIADTFGA